MGVELKLVQGLPYHSVSENDYDIIFLLAKSEEVPWLIQETSQQELIQKTANYVFAIFKNKKPEEENPVVNIEYAFSLTEEDCLRLISKLKERPGIGRMRLPCKTEASDVRLNIQTLAADHYWLTVKHPSRIMTPYSVSGEDLSQICELFEISEN